MLSLKKGRQPEWKKRVFWYYSNSVFPVWVSKRGLLKWPTVDKIKCMHLRQAMLALVQPLCIPADCWHDVDLIAVKLSDQVRINDVLITCVSYYPSYYDIVSSVSHCSIGSSKFLPKDSGFFSQDHSEHFYIEQFIYQKFTTIHYF